MKIALTTTGNTLDAQLHRSFGRTPRILVYDSDAGTFEVIDNSESVGLQHGAGIKTAESVAKLGATMVITGQCGPNALNVLEKANIDILYSEAATVRQALEQNSFIDK